MRHRQESPNLVRALEQWRQELGYNHGRFAEHLGISAGSWTRIRKGQRGVTNDLAKRLIERREQLRAFWLADLMAA